MKEKIEKEYLNPWLYKGEIFTGEMIGDYFGFVYKITNKTNGRWYIGKKQYSKSKILEATKGSKNVPPRKRKKIRVPSDWQDYYGSSDELKADVLELGIDNFSREIIHLCLSTSHCSYLETKEIFLNDAILKKESYNSWVTCKITSSHVGKFKIS